MFSLSVALAVAAIPEGLVIGVTVVLTIGMQEYYREMVWCAVCRRRKHWSSTTIICTDKTGTLTVGEMRLAYRYPGHQIDLSQIAHEGLPSSGQNF